MQRRKRGRPRLKYDGDEPLCQLQLRIESLYLRRINEIAEENYSSPSATLRGIVHKYFKILDEREKRRPVKPPDGEVAA